MMVAPETAQPHAAGQAGTDILGQSPGKAYLQEVSLGLLVMPTKQAMWNILQKTHEPKKHLPFPRVPDSYCSIVLIIQGDIKVNARPFILFSLHTAMAGNKVTGILLFGLFLTADHEGLIKIV